MLKLKTCPFCGGKAHMSFIIDDSGIIYFISCCRCSAQVVGETKTAARARWNMRCNNA